MRSHSETSRAVELPPGCCGLPLEVAWLATAECAVCTVRGVACHCRYQPVATSSPEALKPTPDIRSSANCGLNFCVRFCWLSVFLHSCIFSLFVIFQPLSGIGFTPSCFSLSIWANSTPSDGNATSSAPKYCIIRPPGWSGFLSFQFRRRPTAQYYLVRHKLYQTLSSANQLNVNIGLRENCANPVDKCLCQRCINGTMLKMFNKKSNISLILRRDPQSSLSQDDFVWNILWIEAH